MEEPYDKWLSQGIQEYTNSGNLKTLPRKIRGDQILEFWASFSPYVKKNSLKVSGLNLAIDGSEDHLIQYF